MEGSPAQYEDGGVSDWLPATFSSMVAVARDSWLPLRTVLSFLVRGAPTAVSIIYDAVGNVGPPERPESGSLFIVDERRLGQWRRDQHQYCTFPRSRPLAGVVERTGRVLGTRCSPELPSPAEAAEEAALDVLLLTLPQEQQPLEAVLEWAVAAPAELLRGEGGPCYLSLIHISEPTRPY